MKVLAIAMLLLSIPGVPAQQSESGSGRQIKVSVDTHTTSKPVSKYEYGMFIEHIRDTMYRSLWSEMLDDRKFYYPITSSDAPSAPAPQDGAPPSNPRRKWRPLGPDSAVVMDKNHPFVGDQSPKIDLDSSTPHGIRQTGLALVKGKRYTGRIILRGTPGTHVKVTLVWGTGEGERQTVSINTVPGTYTKIPLSFTAQAGTEDGALEISGTGTGNVHIGAVSLMPADNLHGFRPDTIALLRPIKMGFWRYGGNYTSGLIWYHIIGDPDKRPPDFDYAWGAMQTNDLGLDEFMTLCDLLNVEPYISVNAGFGDSHSAAEEVEYMNGAPTTHMGAMRARNGHTEPYHVKFWNIGNEPWGAWQLGRTDTKYFMMKHNEFAKAMRQVDPSIVLIASGRMLQDDTLRGEARAKYEGNLGPLYGTEEDWTGSFLKDCWGNFDGIAEHWYAQPGRRFDPEKAKKLPFNASNDDANVKIDQTLLQASRFPADVVLNKAQEWEGYQQRFPAMDDKIFLSIDEYAYFGGGFNRGVNLRLALAYGMIFDEMLRHTPFLTMAAHTTGVSLLDITKTASTLNTTGLMFKLYGDHFVGAIPVAVSGDSPQPKPRFPASGDQPATTSGSPTYPLDVVAALTPDRKSLTIAIVNATESEQSIDLQVDGRPLNEASTLWQLTASSLDAANHVGQPAQVSITEHQVPANSQIHIAPISVSVYQFPLTQAR